MPNPFTSSTPAPISSFEDSYALSQRRLGQDYSGPDTRKKVVVTGGSGKLGRVVVKHLADHGWTVINWDITLPLASDRPHQIFVKTDLNDEGQVLGNMIEVDDKYRNVNAVVHLAAIPAPSMVGNGHLFHTNMGQIYNIFESARKLKIKNIVWASSETVLGLPLYPHLPAQLPLDESIERPESSYSLSKLLGEKMADQYTRWDPELKIASLRFSNVMVPTDYARFPLWQDKPFERAWNAFAYIDARDGAQAVRKALEATYRGHEVFAIANSDSTHTRPTAELMKECFPGVPYTPLDHRGPRHSGISIEKARELLGFEPEFNWQDEVKKLASATPA